MSRNSTEATTIHEVLYRILDLGYEPADVNASPELVSGATDLERAYPFAAGVRAIPEHITGADKLPLWLVKYHRTGDGYVEVNTSTERASDEWMALHFHKQPISATRISDHLTARLAA